MRLIRANLLSGQRVIGRVDDCTAHFKHVRKAVEGQKNNLMCEEELSLTQMKLMNRINYPSILRFSFLLRLPSCFLLVRHRTSHEILDNSTKLERNNTPDLEPRDFQRSSSRTFQPSHTKSSRNLWKISTTMAKPHGSQPGSPYDGRKSTSPVRLLRQF